MKRYLSLWFPDWPLTRLRRARYPKARSPRSGPSGTVRPYVLVEKSAHGLTIAAANPAAKNLSITEGLRFTDAKARAPDLQSEEIDRAADAAALRKLAAWLLRVAPTVVLQAKDALLLEVTGCARMYGGEDALFTQARALLRQNGFPHQAAMAGTPGAAIALSRHRDGVILPPGEEKAGLSELPISALRLSEDAQALLRRFGLTRVHQLIGIDRGALARRFRSKEMSDAVLLRLDQALGYRPEPVVPLLPEADYSVRLQCPDPLISTDAVRLGLEKLADELCWMLKDAGEGARSFILHAFRADGTKAGVGISAAQATHDPKHILRLFAERLAKVDPGFGVDLLLLQGFRTDTLNRSARAFAGLAAVDADEAALASLADRITARLGEGTALIVQHQERRLPEKAEAHVPYEGSLPAKPRTMPRLGPRPLRLLETPERVQVLAEVPDGPPRSFRWRRVQRRVIRAEGPERIAPEWALLPPSLSRAPAQPIDKPWLDPKLDPRADAQQIVKVRTELEKQLSEEESDDTSVPIRNLPRARDYYRIEDGEGRRYWLFREGLYDDGRGGAPEWYVHGLFS